MKRAEKIDSKNIEDLLALTPMQEGMLFHYLHSPGEDFYFNQLCLEVVGSINPRYFTEAWNFVIQTNEMLRTVFRWEKLVAPTQAVLKSHSLRVRVEDLSHIVDGDEQQKKWEAIKQQDRDNRFDLREVPFRIILVKRSPCLYNMIISNHHILYDGWSTGIILKEFLQVYETLVNGSQPAAPPVKPGFKEFIRWYREMDKHKQKKFWQNYLAGLDSPTRLPIKRLRPAPGIAGVGNYRVQANPSVKDKLEVFVREKRLTLAAVFYCTWGLLLQKYCRREDVVFGVTVSGRPTAIKEIENIVGLFINTLPLRTRLDAGENVLDFLVRINNHLVACEEYENTPLADIYSYCPQVGNPREEYFDTIVSVENYPLDSHLKEMSPHFSIRSHSLTEAPHYDLTLVISAGAAIDILFIYKNTSFDKEVVIRLGHHFLTLLESIARKGEARLNEIEMLSEEEKTRLLIDFNRSAEVYPRGKTIGELFSEQAGASPDRVGILALDLQGVSGAKVFFTYRELAARSDRMAMALVEKGIRGGDIVGIMVERSLEMMAGILGILKAGGAYLPIDPSYPQERVNYMLTDSKAVVLITTAEEVEKRSALNERFVNGRLSRIDCQSACIVGNRLACSENHPHLPPAPATSLAYIIYTSGSTGKPKGVMVEQGSVVNLLFSLQRRYPLYEQDAYLLKTSYLFDVSVTELFGWFLRGGRLVILPPGREKDPEAILETTARERVTHLNFVPSQFNTFVDILNSRGIAALAGLKYIFLAGEALPSRVVHRFRGFNRAIAIENIYGPTEATVYATWFSLEEWNGQDPIPIGKPLPNTVLLILDNWSIVQSPGVPGELCIGGEGVARGYLNNPELTFKRFITFNAANSPGRRRQKLYKTGDLARWLPEGNVEYLGRLDFQVKIRGFRIELGEIESHVFHYPGVKEAVVTVQTGTFGDHFLCAYVVPCPGKDVDVLQLTSHLREKLPDYMIPACFVTLEAIPLTSSGKVNRGLLPRPTVKSTKAYIPPGNELELGIVNIWAAILGMDGKQIGIDDNFFELGGHSLKITTLLGHIYKHMKIEVPFSEVFRKPTVRELARYIGSREQNRYNEIPLAEKKEYYLLSPAQKRLYVLQQMDVKSMVYHIQRVLMLEGEVDKEKLTEVFGTLITRHESLRTSFPLIDDVPVQRIHRENDRLPIRQYNQDVQDFGDGPGVELPVCGNPVPNVPKGFRRPDAIIKSVLRPFALSRAPLLRTTLIEIDYLRHILVVDMHHIISDGFSLGILIREFMAIYQDNKLPMLRLRYTDFSQWFFARRECGAILDQERYWLKQFAGELPVLNLPIDFPRPVPQDFSGAQAYFRIGAEETGVLREVALNENTTLFAVLVSLFTIFLSRLSGQEDIIIGSPVTGRRHIDFAGVVGMFVNLLALRCFPAGEKTFPRFLRETGSLLTEALDNQEYSFEDLVERLNIARDASRNPLFDVAFALLDPDLPGLEIPGLKVTPYEYDPNVSKFDLTLTAEEVGDRLHFTLQYCTKLFKIETIERFIGYFKQLVASIVENPGQTISTPDILSSQEKRRLAIEFNDTGVNYSNDKTIHGLFAEQVKKTPNHIALAGPQIESTAICGCKRDRILLTYDQVDVQSNRLAHQLKERGVEPGTLVGIMLERSIEMIFAILGILKTGCAYLPMDPESPADRIAYILKDSNTPQVINETFLRGFQGGISAGFFKKRSATAAQEELGGIPGKDDRNEKKDCFFPVHLRSISKKNPAGRRRQHLTRNPTAYVIYTSGSSGKPKGVPVTHANFSPLIHWGYHLLEIGPKDRVLQNLSYYFDWSVWEMFIALTTGASLYMVSRDVIMNPGTCIEFLRKHALTILHITPTHYSFLVKQAASVSQPKPVMETLRYLFLGAEKLGYELAKRSIEAVNPGCRIFNMYGPTEATIISAVSEIDRSRLREYRELNGVPIGRPSGNLYLLVLDRYLNLCPVKVAGELHIGGDGVTQGYLNKPELTVEKFCLRRPGGLFLKKSPPWPSHKNGLLFHLPIYKTGDWVRWLGDGSVEFLGRMDHQVKIMGHRMELGEIENRLLGYTGIREAVVAVKENRAREKYLCAYIVSADDFDHTKLKRTLSQFLPNYMIPACFIRLERLPLTPNKKIDLRALPDPEMMVSNTDMVPTGAVEKRLSEIWSAVLGIEKEMISVDSDFFQLGGHSLKATLLTARIEKELKVKVPLPVIFVTPTIRGLAEYIYQAQELKFQSCVPVEKQEYYPLSSTQRRLFILQQMDERGISYNIPSVFMLEGQIDKGKLEQVFLSLIRRHESFRTYFPLAAEKPVQRIHDELKIEIECYEVEMTGTGERCGWGGTTRGLEPLDGTIQKFLRPFDLSRAPLLRVGLVVPSGERTAEDNRHGHAVLMIDMHHIIADGVSMNIVVKNFTDLYSGKDLPELRIQYKDFSGWQNRPTQRESLKQQEGFWLREFVGETPALELPVDYSRPGVKRFEGSSNHFEISNETTAGLNALTRETGTTMYMALLAFYTIFLSKISGGEDIVVGSPVAGRRHADLENIVGMFANTLAQRNSPAGEKRFADFLMEVKEKALNAFENQEYQYEDLVEQVAVCRDTSRNPLFDTMFVLQNTDVARVDVPGLKISPYTYENKTAKFDLTLSATEIEDKLYFTFEYSTTLFRAATIEQFISYFKKIISGVIDSEEKHIRLSDIGMMPEKEKRRVLSDFNDTAVEFPHDKPLHRLFEEQVERTPCLVAVVGKSQGPDSGRRKELERSSKIAVSILHVTYGELNKKADRLACELLQKGIEPDCIVGIRMEQSLEMIEGILGILKAGGAYLPIAPELPRERLNYMMKDSGAKILLETPGTQVFSPALTPTCRVRPDNLAYIIYTSGSTGKPKGVMVNHEGVFNTIYWRRREYKMGPGDRVLQLFSFTFDGFITSFFTPVVSGALAVQLSSDETKDIQRINRIIVSRGITHVLCVPSFYRMLLEISGGIDFSGLKVVTLAGEQVQTDLVEKSKQLCPATEVVNEYGPTEGSIAATICRDVRPVGPISIGKPIANAGIYIVDRYEKIVPVGIPGELTITGKGLARGYLNNPELTSEKFIFNSNTLLTFPSSSGTQHSKKLYKTGDHARWMPDGGIEFLGRRDFQVKIRGYRIELAEIEHRLLRYNGIKEAVIIPKEGENEEKYLCAYFTPGTGTDIPGIKEYLSSCLPGYMIPSVFMTIEKVPLTPNGKVDRKLLPDPFFAREEEYVAPGNENEEKMVEAWAEVLGIAKEKIGIHDNFFDLGGNSLKIMRLSQKLGKILNREINVLTLFRYVTISALSKYLSKGELCGTALPNPGRLKEIENSIQDTLQLFNGN